ncbi:MAG: SDR family oxidoreductase [Pseudomonadales bacterium]|nr:SDR family oxidoreductase [Pseudomonadales bacterium]
MVITGGGRGIGAATALLAARAGYDVCLSYRSDEQAAGQVAARIEAVGRRAWTVQADVSNEADITRLFRCVDNTGRRLSVLVNNAGTLETHMPVAEMTAARLQRVFATNITGSFLCAIEAVKRMAISRGGAGGAIVNVSSVASRLGSPNEYVDYAASKGAIDSFTIGLAKEVAMDGIRVNAVRPGVIYTDIHALGGEPDRVDRVAGMVPMGRGGQPQEVAEAIMWLASTQSSYTTGTLLDVSGGR